CSRASGPRPRGRRRRSAHERAPSRALMIDTHCHLCDKRFDKDRAQVLDRARVAGVTHVIEIAYAPEILAKAHALAREHAWAFLCVGVHPSESARVPDDHLAALREPPAEMLVLETDAPYLEPEPRSLRRNEPGLLARVLPRLAELRGWTLAEAERITTANARELFRLPIAV